MLEAKLVVVGGDLPEKEFALRLPAVIGRGREADIVIGHPLVSRRHCELLEADGELVVHDLSSLNGTFVGREQVYRQVILPGELLTVGNVTFRAVYNDWTEEGLEPVERRPADDNTRAIAADDTCLLKSDANLSPHDDATHAAQPQLSTGPRPR